MLFKFPVTVPFYAFFMAGPCDFAINVGINTAIPWYVFSEEHTPLYGRHSLVFMLLAITFCCATLTTVSGFFNCMRERRAGRVVPPTPAETRWKNWRRIAWRTGLKRGVIALGLASLVAAAFYPAFAEQMLPTWSVIAAAGLYAGTLGYWLHAWAVVTAGNINQPDPVTTQE